MGQSGRATRAASARDDRPTDVGGLVVGASRGDPSSRVEDTPEVRLVRWPREVVAAFCAAVLIAMAVVRAAEPHEAPIDWISDVERLLKSAAVGREAAVSKPKMVHRSVQTISALLDYARKAAQREDEVAVEAHRQGALSELDHAVRKGHFRPEALAPVYELIERYLPRRPALQGACHDAAGSGSLPLGTCESTWAATGVVRAVANQA